MSLRFASAAAFALVSFVIVFTNKFVLTTWQFPSVKFVALCQCLATCVIMFVQQNCFGKKLYPSPSLAVFRKIMPLPLLFFFNMMSGLSATKALNIPMFVLLRRFSIAMTLALEFFVLQKSSTRTIVASVALMITGALVAAIEDVTVDSWSVFSILLNDVFTALQGVTLKMKMNEAADAEKLLLAKKQDSEQRSAVGRPDATAVVAMPPSEDESGQNDDERHNQQREKEEEQEEAARLTADGVMFYNSLISAVPAALFWLVFPSEVSAVVHFKNWVKPAFVFWFLCSMFLGFLLNYTYFLCTKHNSALTSTVVGSAKNCISSYVGMMMGDYKYSPLSFVGVNISVFAALMYTYGEVNKNQQQAAVVDEKKEEKR